MNYKFFCHKACEWFPCHKTKNPEEFNCLFCYCPLISDINCGGQFTVLNNGWKDCSACMIPHTDYEYIVSKLIQNHYKET